jgi:hypothetical protein
VFRFYGNAKNNNIKVLRLELFCLVKERKKKFEMAEELRKNGLFLDESYILRVLEPSILKDTHDLKEENEVFQESQLGS